MQVVGKPALLFAIVLSLTGCAALNMGWYKPGVSAQEFNQDKFDCMSGSQMQVSTSNVQGTGSTYYGGGNVTCNTSGSTTNCSGGGGYSQPGYVSGSSASYVTTNMPLFQACMQARGYVWTSQAEVEKYEASQAPDQSSEDSQESQTDSNDVSDSTGGASTDWYAAFDRCLRGLPKPTSKAAIKAAADTCERAVNADASQTTTGQAASDDTSGPDVETSVACRKFDDLNKGLAAGTVTQQQFDAQFQTLMKACDAGPESPSEQASSDDMSGSDVDTSPACRKLDALNKGLATGTVTQQQFNAQFQPLMKACDGVP